MKITLRIDGELKVFDSRGISMKACHEAFDIQMEGAEMIAKGATNIYTPERIERMVLFVVALFRNQFTEQEFVDGYEDSFYALMPVLTDSVIEGITAKIQEFPPNAEAPKTEKKKG